MVELASVYRGDLEQFDQKAFEKQIPQLVNQAIEGKTKKANLAKKHLVEGIDNSDDLKPDLLIVRSIQEALVSATGKKIPAVGQFLTEMVLAMGDDMAEQGVKSIELSISVKNLAADIERNHDLLKERNTHRPSLSGSYHKFIRGTIGVINEGIAANQPGVIILFAGGVTEKPMQKDYLTARSEWVRKIVMRPTPIDQGKPSLILRTDNLITALREEPRNPDSLQQTIFEKKYADISLSDIETFPYPLTQEHLESITHYLLDVVASHKSLSVTRKIIHEMFSPHYFRGLNTATNPTNKELLKRTNGWLMETALKLISSSDEPIDPTLAELFRASQSVTSSAIMMLYTLSGSSHSLDPESKVGEAIPWEKYPLFKNISSWYAKNLPKENFYEPVYMDELGKRYFREIAVPKLKDQLQKLGIIKSQSELIQTLEKSTVNYEKDLLKNALEEFRSHCGEQFLGKLETHKEDIAKITQEVWSKIVGNAHFLPFHEGYNIVDFSEKSLPFIIGLKAIHINTSGNDSASKVNITLDMQNSNFSLNGTIDKTGDVKFRADISNVMPGLHAILQHIAVLTLHDLVIQEKKQQNKFHLSVEDRKKTDEDSSVHSSENRRQTDEKRHNRSLPRLQKDTALMQSAHKDIKFEPRRVELYKRYVGHGRKFEELCRKYQDELTQGSSEQSLELVKQQIVDTGSKLWSPSEEKVKNVPVLLSLDTIIDPTTGKKVYLHTWVAEHSSPKPTPDELKSPLTLYQRYYKDSSALSFLDQMLPWLIGE